MSRSAQEWFGQFSQVVKLFRKDITAGLPAGATDQIWFMALGASLLILLLSALYFARGDKPVIEGDSPRYSSVGHMKRLATHLGEVEVRLIGDTAAKGTVVCLNGINPKLVKEWIPVGVRLAADGFRVAIIDFHSNERTKPKLFWGGVRDEDVHRILRDDLIGGMLGADRVVLMGKSWGGRQAALFAARHADLVAKLCLVCPASSDEALVRGVRESGRQVLLAWARDDYVKWYSSVSTWQRELGPALELLTAQTGGHFVLPEYAEPIARFVSRP